MTIERIVPTGKYYAAKLAIEKNLQDKASQTYLFKLLDTLEKVPSLLKSLHHITKTMSYRRRS
jgi:hypothetical protein